MKEKKKTQGIHIHLDMDADMLDLMILKLFRSILPH